MSFELGLIIVLLVYLVAREIFFIYSTNKLLNKLMSRNYQDFAFSSGIVSAKSEKKGHDLLESYNPDLHEDFDIVTDIRNG